MFILKIPIMSLFVTPLQGCNKIPIPIFRFPISDLLAKKKTPISEKKTKFRKFWYIWDQSPPRPYTIIILQIPRFRLSLMESRRQRRRYSARA